MLGKNACPLNVTFLGLTQGINALDITLVPWDSSSICSTTWVLIPDLFKFDLTVWIALVITWLPCCEVCTLDAIVPDHCVSHEFHTVPNLFEFAALTASKFPSTLIIKSGAVSVSNQSSLCGSRSMFPTHCAVITGCTFSTLDAYGFSDNVSLE